jgi:DNA polymerase-1
MEAPDLRVHVLDHPDKMGSFWRWLTNPARTFVACDVETTGLDWSVPGFKVRMIQFGDDKGGWAIPFEGWRALVGMAIDYCARARVVMVWHNLAYDSLALKVEGIELDWSIQADTFVLASLGGFCEDSRKLKACGVAELGSWAGMGEVILKRGMDKQGWTWASVPFGWKPFPMYGVVDVCVTALLWLKWQDRYKRWRAMHDLEIATIRVVGEMSWRGIAVDIPYLEKTVAKLTGEQWDLERTLAEYNVDPAKPRSIVTALELADQFPPDTLLTGSGQKSTAAVVLRTMKHPLAAAVIRHRWVKRVKDNYLQVMLDRVDSNGVVHPGIKGMEAKTGRMAIERPPMQQLPDDELVRAAIIGYRHFDEPVVVSSDWSQIELRIWGSVNKDTALIEALKLADKSDTDFFTALCRSIYHEPGFIKGDERRTKVKSSAYAKLFGGGIEVAAATAGVGVYAMVPTWRTLGERFPSMATGGSGLIQQEKTSSGTIHYAMSPFDRRFAVRQRGEIRKIPNYDCQGTAAIALKKALVGCQAVGLSDYLMLPVHDEILGSCPRKDVGEVMHELGGVMNSIITEAEWGISVPAEPSFGDNWSEAKHKDQDALWLTNLEAA